MQVRVDPEKDRCPLAVETNQPTALAKYETIRRRQYTVITDLLEVLPKINNLSPEYTAQARDALFHADHPYLMVFVGPFSSGKSSLINALLGESDLLEVGPVPTTDRISILRYGEEKHRMNSGGETDTVFYPAEILKRISLVDTPGLESVFERHEEITRKFLHRADAVILVMLATQAMTASNLEYLKKLREYGKKIIILVNQADLLSPEQRETVKKYVTDESLGRLGYKPPVFMVSAKIGQAAHAGSVSDAEKWRESGLAEFDAYIDTQITDIERMRQKLQTPLQIVQNVTSGALNTLRAEQAVIDHYQSIRANIDQQLTAQKREQEKTVREISEEVRSKFSETAARGGEAIREVFQLSQSLKSLGRGVGELTGLSRLFRRADTPNYVVAAFAKHKVLEPLDQLPQTVAKLGPRLEGRDLQDIDDLVKYAQQEIRDLPPTLRAKLIGSPQAPVSYDRRPLQEMSPELERIEAEARKLKTEVFARSAKSALIYLVLFEIVLVIFGVALLLSGIGETQGTLLVVVMFVLIGLGSAALALMPIVGQVMKTRYANQLYKLQNQYVEVIGRAAEKQLEYGMRLRNDAVMPLVRLIDAQTAIQNELLERLRSAEQEMAKLESEIVSMGKRNFLGIGAD